ncbi:hypothetical protein F5141DRAFT_1191066 [Pisolithus sp. B1]|nr:hypothetical protein F5141DRAFT_1191066 [Pisolithus sp. B1]
MASIPPQGKYEHLRVPTDYKQSGCKNCEEIIQGSMDRMSVCTTTYFDGIIVVIDPVSSWVARWQRTSKYVRLPEDVEAELENRQTDQD